MTENAASPGPNATAGMPVPSRQRPAQRRMWLAWLWVLLWAAVIWTLGTDSYSLHRTSRILQPLITWLFGELDLPTRYKLMTLIRKSAHFFEYAVLALLAFRAALISAAQARITTAGWVALFFVATVAAADEIRQGFSAARTGSPYDVLIDLAGGVVGLVGMIVISRRMRPTNPVGSTA